LLQCICSRLFCYHTHARLTSDENAHNRGISPRKYLRKKVEAGRAVVLARGDTVRREGAAGHRGGEEEGGGTVGLHKWI